MPSQFRNEPLSDFSKPKIRKAMENALALVRSQLGASHPLWIGGKEIHTSGKIISVNPSKKSEVIGEFAKADGSLVETAIEAASAAFESWKNVSAKKRAEYLFQAAKIIRKRKFEFSAWMVFEVGKSWAEADGDVAETIDFLEFYAREALRYAGKQPLLKIKGEKNHLEYIPLGVGIVIPPWNFPMAIMAGMTTAAIVAGNTVILKPSSESPAIAYKFFEVMQELGLPDGVINYCTGSGGTFGDGLVAHAKTRFIAFTGSKEVGLHINELAAKHQKGQLWIKRVVAEMGGKDGIIVAKDADLDKAARGVLQSAFGFQGQKCSACSRAIIDRSVYDKFVKILLDLAPKKLKQGNVENGDVNFGPVVSESAFKSITDYIRIGKGEGELLLGGNSDSSEGFFIEPTIIGNVAPKARISQEEIFGPVLALIKAEDYDDALNIANNTEFGLTGAVYTKSKKNIQRAEKEFHVGNLYINRKCTGAMVGAHPFGGFNMSGTDSKAGGRDYLGLFSQAKVWVEKVKG